MTTTAHEDQFTTATQTIVVVREAYDTVAILRRNIADAEKEMQCQAERAESYADALRSLASYVGAGGYNADTVDAGVFEAKVRWGIGEIMARMEKADAELKMLAQQKPAVYMSFSECGQFIRYWTRDSKILDATMAVNDFTVLEFYAAPVHVPHKGATHCDDCGLTWLDDGLNPLRCPYCKESVPAPAVPAEWREAMQEAHDTFQRYADLHWAKDTRDSHEKAKVNQKLANKLYALLQSAEVRHD